jgi:signal transduction histidine kinase
MTSLFSSSRIDTNKRVHLFVRVLWLMIAGLSLALIAAALIYRINRPWQFEESDYLAVARLGLTIPFYNGWYSAQELVVPVVWAILAVCIFFLQPRDRGAQIFSIALLTFPIAGPPTFNALVRDHSVWRIPYQLVSSIGLLSSYLGFYIFPDGHFIPRWTRWLIPVCVAWVIFAKSARGLWHDTPAGSIGHLALLLLGAFALFYRYRHTPAPAQRQQIKWVVYALILTVIGQLLAELYFTFIVAVESPDWEFRMVAYNIFALPVLLVLPQLFVALAMTFSILQYRLWEIDVVINRTLVYGVLTALIVGIYVLIVGGLGTLFQSRGSIAISLSAAGVIAVVFQPLRERLQRGINHLMYGERDEPYRVITRLSQRLEAALEPAAALPLTVETVAHALKLPYVAITLGDKENAVAAYGNAGLAERSSLDSFPLVYSGETIGELLTAPRAAKEPLSQADRILLNDLAKQISIAAHATVLSADLERARLRIVATREETRRRLGSDLHDGIGHQLAGLARKTDSAAKLLERDPIAAREFLAEVTGQLNNAIAQVRSLAHQLHPPELELLGLAGALRERAQMQTGFMIQIDAPENLPALPTAVETAAYYIVLEALTNIEKHADARTANIRIAFANGSSSTLEIDITDDGRGLPPQPARGLGLLSMQARAAEVGGSCQIESNPVGGTRVRVSLPVLKE